MSVLVTVPTSADDRSVSLPALDVGPLAPREDILICIATPFQTQEIRIHLSERFG